MGWWCLHHCKRGLILMVIGLFMSCKGNATEVLSLDVISYEDFIQEDPQTLDLLKKALYEKGIVGVKGVPGYREKALQFFKTAREFVALPEEVKEVYAPDHDRGEMFLGYQRGKEKFMRPDGKWVIDDLKVSYYGLVPDLSSNKWPGEIDLKYPFQELGMVMSEMATKIMEKIGLIGPSSGIYVDDVPRVGRMLYYAQEKNSIEENPFWCGSHFDHGLFTALLPAIYVKEGEIVPEPSEAGLFVKTSSDGEFKKVIANDPDVLLFQVGEFAQLVMNDQIKATEHRVHKAPDSIERYTMALFFDVPMETVIYSTSELTADNRYGGEQGLPCSYQRWTEESFKRYIVKEEDTN